MSLTDLRTDLLRWYDRNGRDLPWRVRRGRPDPYRVWLSEVMLQQTLAATVAPYFERFVALWPTAGALAAAPREDVLREWAGLGYYARARNLHEAARALAADGIPRTEAGWRALPGVGPYTAAAVAAIAFGAPANVVDGNVERVMARLFAVEAPLPQAKTQLKTLAGQFVKRARAGAWAQALMDLGATVCTPRAPNCARCPVASSCRAYQAGAAQDYPRRGAKVARPRRHGVAFWLERGGSVLLTSRPDKGLLGGMLALPSTSWRAAPWVRDEARAQAPTPGAWRPAGAIEHVFTHFQLTLEVWTLRLPASARVKRAVSPAARWTDVAGVDSAGLPSVFRKAAACARAS